MPDASVSLGLDAREMYQELNNAAVRFNQAASRIEGGSNRAAHASDGLLVSNHRVARQISNFSQELIRGGSAADVFAAGLEGVERSFRLPIGSLAGLAIGAILFTEIHKTNAEAEKLHEEIEKIVHSGTGNPRYQALESLNKQLDDAKQKLEELNKHRESGFTNALRFIGSSHIFGGKGFDAVQEQDAKDDAAARAKIEKTKTDVAEKANEKNQIEETKTNLGDFAAERLKIEQTRKEKAGAAIEAKNVPLQAQANDEADIALAALDKKEQAQKRAIALEEKLTAIKKTGADVEVKSAEAVLAARKADLAAANSEGKGGAQAKVDAAQQELEAARKTSAAKKDQLSTETAIANVVGTADDKKRAQLARERADLEKQLANATPDERRELEPKLAKNKEAQRNFDLDQSEKTFSTRETQIDAHTGRGEGEHELALVEKIRLQMEHIAKLKKTPLVDLATLAEAGKKLNDLNKSLADIQDARVRSQRSSEAELEAMQAQEQGEEHLATLIQLRAQAEERVRAAVQNGNPALADTEQKKGEEGLIEAQAKENIRQRNLTPQQRAGEAQQKREFEHEVDRVRDHANRVSENSDARTPETGFLDQIDALRQARADEEDRSSVEAGVSPAESDAADTAATTGRDATGFNRAEQVRNGDARGGGQIKGAPDFEKTNSILEKIEKNTADAGKNK